jgi:hypothetical protein
MADEPKRTDATQRIQELEGRLRELERTLIAKEKMVSVLMQRVERSVDTTGSAFSIFDRSILLESLVAQRTRELQDAIGQIKQLSGLLPICAACKKIRDDQGYWRQVERFFTEHSEVQFSHGICPDCAEKLYPDIAKL